MFISEFLSNVSILTRDIDRVYFNTLSMRKKSQELSYCQQIARQLRTRCAEGIYNHKYYTVTLKSRLSVTQGH